MVKLKALKINLINIHFYFIDFSFIVSKFIQVTMINYVQISNRYFINQNMRQKLKPKNDTDIFFLIQKCNNILYD